MRIEVKIIDDNGDVLATHVSDASQPSMWRSPSGSRFVSDMPRQSDQPATGTYELFGITFQPHLRVDRPNGYVAPLPSFPVSGNQQRLPDWPRPPISTTPTFSSNSILSGPNGSPKGSQWTPSSPSAATSLNPATLNQATILR